MEISGYVASLRRWWWTLLVALWVAALAGYLATIGMTRIYEAETRLLVGPFNTDLTTQRASGQLTQTYAELVTSQPLLNTVIDELGLDGGVEGLSRDVTATPNDITRFLTIRVQDADPGRAAAIANALAQALDELASGAAGILRPEGEIQVIDTATEPTTPIAPQVSVIVMMSAAGGLVAAIVLVLMLELLSTRIRSAEDLSRAAALPVLASLGRTATPESDSQLRTTQPGPVGPVAGAYRVLSTRLVDRGTVTRVRTLLVQATAEQDGSDAFAADLAAVLAERTRRVTLVTDAVTEPVKSATGVTWRRDPGFGADDSLRARRGLMESVDILVVHVPALDASPAGMVWAHMADAVVIVACRDVTDRRMAAATAESMRSMSAPLVGAVLLLPASRGSLLGRFRREEPGLATDTASTSD